MKRSAYSPGSASMRCASRSVDSVGTARGWGSAERGGKREGVGFGGGKHGRGKGPGQDAGADLDGAHGARVTAVDARLAGQYLAAHDARFDVEQQALGLHGVAF